MNRIEALKHKLRDFAKERDWEKYHSPKNLAMGISVEVAELLEIFLWLSEDRSRELTQEELTKVREEIGDVMIYLTNLADKYGLDPIECAESKIQLNKQKYPSSLVKSSAKKYTEYSEK